MIEISPLAVRDVYTRITAELGKVMVGQEAIIRLLLVSLFSRGHCLLVGVPGLAKTLLVRSLAETLTLSFKRIQFTPDLMPSDIIGSELLQERDRKLEFEYFAGPIFANLLLADEVNRTPPKTQSALLEAMQEHKVTVGGQSRALLDGKLAPETEDVRAVALPVLQHRVITNYRATGAGKRSRDIVAELVKLVQEKSY